MINSFYISISFNKFYSLSTSFCFTILTFIKKSSTNIFKCSTFSKMSLNPSNFLSRTKCSKLINFELSRIIYISYCKLNHIFSFLIFSSSNSTILFLNSSVIKSFSSFLTIFKTLPRTISKVNFESIFIIFTSYFRHIIKNLINSFFAYCFFIKFKLKSRYFRL